MKHKLRIRQRIKSAWNWLLSPFRYLRNYHEPWISHAGNLLAVAGLLGSYWFYAYQYETDPAIVFIKYTIPAVLGLMSFLLMAATLFHFWKPRSPNFFSQEVELSKLYRPWMLSVLPLLAIGGMLYGFWKLNASNPAGVQPKPQPDPGVSLRFEEVELRGRKDGTPFFTILAEKVEVSKENRYVNFLKGKTKPHGEFYNLKDWEDDPTGAEPKRRAITWESNSARYDTIDQNLEMKGQVRIKTDLDDRIQTEEMLWNRNQQTLTSNTRTQIHTHHDAHIGANKLKVETTKKSLYLEGRVYIDMKIGEEVLVDGEKIGEN